MTSIKLTYKIRKLWDKLLNCADHYYQTFGNSAPLLCLQVCLETVLLAGQKMGPEDS
jgi:hypothetical protein